MNVDPHTYEDLKALQKELNIKRRTDLMVEAPQNDPFYAGCKAPRERGEWFAELWERYGPKRHLRGFHYHIVMLETDILMADGVSLYRNTKKCWDVLNSASCSARYLGLLDPMSLTDKRNPPTQILGSFDREYVPVPSYSIDEESCFDWDLPRIRIDLGESFSLEFPDPLIYGYHHESADRPYNLELIIEKSDAEEELIAFCRRWEITYTELLGFNSVTKIVNMVQRASKLPQPTRIFYLSDYDPAGSTMPVHVARQVQFWKAEYAPDADIKLFHLGITKEQIKRYNLPRKPFEEKSKTDRRITPWEEIHGKGQVELSAYAEVVPGGLDGLVRKAIRPYVRSDLRDRLEIAESYAFDAVDEAWEDMTFNERAELKKLEAETQEVVNRHRKALTAVSQTLSKELEPLRERLEKVRHDVILRAEEGPDVSLPDRPTPDKADVNEDSCLYDSARSYVDQTALLKRALTESDE